MCPEFRFKKVRQFRDALSRQLCEGIMILEEGILNKRNEFRINNICRLVAKKDSKSEEDDRKKRLTQKAKDDELIDNFIKVIRARGECVRTSDDCCVNADSCYRLSTRVVRE